jgi:hypothetical protein
MFKPIEMASVVIDSKSAFLLSYRSIAYELFCKESALRSYKFIREIDKGKSFVRQCEIQDYLHTSAYGLKMGIRDLQRLKERYSNIFQCSEYNNFKYYALKFSDVFPIVCCGALFPEHDFFGNSLGQELGTNKYVEHITLNITSWANEGYVVFGWLDKNGSAEKFASSFHQLSDNDKANLALLLNPPKLVEQTTRLG